MFCPRWASRVTLEITDVRVQRLNQISVEDVWAEGVKRCIYRHGQKPHIQFCDDGPEGFVADPVMPSGGRVYPPIAAFAETWDEINKSTPWGVNPWVWALTFKAVTK